MNDDNTQRSGFNIVGGILLVIFGFVLLGSQVFTSLLSLFMIGWVLLIGGITQFFYGFFSGGWGRAFFFFMAGIFSAIIGLILIFNPVISAVTISGLIGILLLLSGIYKMASSVITQYESWGWTLVGGLVSFLLGLIVLSNWPVSGLWVIGLFIGVELIINGFLLMAGQTLEISQRGTHYYTGAKGGKAKKDTDKDKE